MSLPRISPKKYDEWKLKEPPVEPFFEESETDWEGNEITDGYYWDIDGDLVQLEDLRDYIGYHYETVKFRNGERV